jgi:hypothetical protein
VIAGAFSLLMEPPFVMPGLDPGIHLQEREGGWIAGSSPAMTTEVFPS